MGTADEAVVSTLKATRSGRVAVHLNGQYACTVSQALLARLRLYVGRPLSAAEAAALQAEALAERALGDAYRLLAPRQRSRAELAGRLAGRGHPPETVQRVMQQLDEGGLLNDAAFAQAYAADHRRLAGWGRERIVRELTRLGVEPATIQAAAGEPCAETDEAEQARALAILAKSTPRAPLPAARRRAYQLLLRRGFSAAVAYEAMKAWAAGGAEEPEGSV